MINSLAKQFKNTIIANCFFIGICLLFGVRSYAQTPPSTPSIWSSQTNGVVTIHWSTPSGTITRYKLAEDAGASEYEFSVGTNSFVPSIRGNAIWYAIKACSGPSASNCSPYSSYLPVNIPAASSSVPASLSSSSKSSSPSSISPQASSSSVATQPVPSQPASATLEADTVNSRFNISWSNVSAYKYELQYSGAAETQQVGTSWLSGPTIYSGTSTTVAKSTVTDFVFYQWRVRACNSNSMCSSWTETRKKTFPPIPVSSNTSLSTPASGVTTSMTPCFSWQTDPNATEVTVTVSTTTDFPEKRWQLNVGTSANAACWGSHWETKGVYPNEIGAPLLVSGATYYWRVVTMMPTGYSFTETRSFKPSSAAQAVPSTPTPATLDADSVNSRFVINWSNVSAYKYELQYSGAAETENVGISWLPGPTIYSGTSTTIAKSTVTDFVFYQWRVRACNSDNACSSWAETRKKTFPAIPVSSSTILFSPASGVTTSMTPCFSWQTDPNATDVTVTVSTTTDFPEKRWQLNVGTSARTACWGSNWETKGVYPNEIGAPALVSGATYYWRVVTMMPTGYAFTETRSFKASSAPQAVPSTPAPATLDADSVNSRFVISWSNVSAYKYELQYSGAAETQQVGTSWLPGPTIYSGTSATVSRSTVTDFVFYQWRVRACNSDNVCSSWAETRKKTFPAIPVSSRTSLLTPAGGATTSMAPCFSWQTDPNATDVTVTVSTTTDFPEKRWQLNVGTGARTACWSSSWETKGVYPNEIGAPLLVNGATYYWRVVTMMPTGYAFTETRSFKASNIPLAPTLDAKIIDGNYWQLEWNKPDSSVTRYELSEVFNNQTKLIPFTNDTSYKPQIIGSATYKIVACNSNGCGSASNVQTINVDPAPAVPSIGVTTDVYNHTFTITWGNVTAAKYELQYKGATSQDGLVSAGWKDVPIVSGFNKTIPMLDVQGYVYLQWQVRACTSLGICSAWQISRIKTNQADAVITSVSLLAPANGAMIENTTNAPCFQWQFDPFAKEYVVTLSNSTEFTEKRWATTVTSGTTTCWNSGWPRVGIYANELPARLTSSTPYYWRVVSVGYDGRIGFSGIHSFSMSAIPGVPQLTATISQDKSSWLLQWTRPQGEINKYEIEEDNTNEEGVRWIEHYATNSPDAITFTSNILGETKYKVRACNPQHQCSLYSNVATTLLETAPAAPAGLTINQKVDEQKFELVWSTVTKATKYKLQYIVEDTAEQAKTSTNWLVLGEVDEPRYLQPDVTPYRYYKWRVMACKLSGVCSEWTESPVKMLQQKPTLISPALISPANGAAVYFNNFNTPCLSWALTTEEEARRVTKYAITISPISDFTDRRWHFEVDGRQNQTICWGNGSGWSAKGVYADQLPAGLELNKTYYWRVVAINAQGELGFSETRTFTLSNNPAANNTSPQIISKIYEAETTASAKLSGVVIKTSVAGYSGSGFGNYNAAVGSYIEWSVPSDQANQTILSIRYSNGSTQAIPMDLFLNGTKISSINLAPTGAWDSWKHEHIATSLAAGVNKIKFVTTSLGDPHVDYIQVSTGAILPPSDIGIPSLTAASTNNGKGMQLNWSVPAGNIAYYQVDASYPLDSIYNVTSTSFVLPNAYGATYKVRACNSSLVCGVYSEPLYVTNSIHEAEVASQKVDVQITNSTPGYSGTGFAKFSASGFLEWNARRSVAESGVLIFTYINPGATAHNAEVTRNGVVVGTLSLPPTGATTWTNISLPINLVSGNNYIRFKSAASTDQILVDRLNVQTLTANSPGLPNGGNPSGTSNLIFNLAATDSDGDFTISWSGARSYAELYETVPAQQAQVYAGLKGKYYGYRQLDNENQDLSKVSQAESTISAMVPDATFIATTINYASTGGQVLAKGTNLQTFLNGDAASLSNDPADATDGIIQLTGRVHLDAGSYNFRVRSDDGYSIRMNGAVVAEVNANQAAKTTEHAAFNIARSGEQNIEIIYWDSGKDYTLGVELRSTAGGVYTYLGNSITSYVGESFTQNNFLKRGDGSGNFSHSVFGKAAGKYTYLLKECYQPTSATAPECINIERSITVGASSGGTGSSVSSSSSSSISTTLSPYYQADSVVHLPPPSELPGSPVGIIAGQFRVTESGAASYSVPLNIPGGVAGVAPQLSFDYSSQSGNGLLGQGWSLSGLSAITRCRKTLIHDGEANPITWSNEDRFCLDGQRLMLVSGASYGQPDSEYRTEIDNYSLITAVGGSNGHPDYFKVEAKDGSISFYGFTADSKLTGGAQNTTLTWALNRFQDNVGNGIDFIYNNDAATGQNIDEIRYGFPTPNGALPSATRADFKSRIQFSYDERDDKTDAYVAGYKFSQTRKLASVSIYNTDNSDGFEATKLFRHYQLKYLSRTSTDASYENTLTRLSHIYECVTTNVVGGSCLLPLSFSWGGGSHIAFDQNMTELSFPTAEAGRYVLNNVFADTTGDGKLDLIYLTYEKGINQTHADLSINIAYAQNGTAGLATQERINLYNKPYEDVRIATLDYNADGRQDLAVYDGAQWKIYLAVINAEKQWRISQVAVVNLGSLTDKDTLFMDVDSDGLADAVTREGYYLLKRNNSAGYSNTAYSFSFQLTALTWGSQGFVEMNEPAPSSVGNLTNCTQVAESKKMQQEMAADFNGDGAVDFLGSYIRALICMPPGAAYPAHVSLTYRYALVNIDGELMNYGGELLAPVAVGANVIKLFTVDVNADGLSDLVQLDADKKLSVRMNNGAGFNSAKTWITLSGLPAGSSPQFLDYNNDGAIDVIWRDITKGQMLVHYWGAAASTPVTLFNTSVTEKDSYLVMDINGDSVVDYLRISSESISGRIGKMAIKAEPVCEQYPTGRGNEMRMHCNDPSYPVSEDQQHNAIYKIENGLGNITQIAYGALSNRKYYQTADVNPDVIPTVVNNNCPANIPAYCSPTHTTYSVDSSAFYGRLNGRWEVPADHKVFNPTTKEIVAASTTTDKGNPVLEVDGSMQVVTTVKSSAPLPNAPKAMSEVDYFYSEAKMQAMGRGFLGFNRLKTVDVQTGITTVTSYRQDFPFIGSPLSTTVYKNNLPGASILSYAINNWDAQVLGSDGARRFQPYLKQSTEYSYVMDSTGSVSAEAIQTVTTDTVMSPNEHGNVKEVTSITQGSGKTITKTTTNEYYSDDWALRMGRLKSSSVNTSGSDGESVTRTAQFKYYGVGGEGIGGGAKGLLKEEKIVVSNDHDQLVTKYTYDQWGNKHSVSVTGQAGDNETQTRSTTSSYDPSGRNLELVQNQLGQTSAFNQYNVYGQPQVVTDKNKLLAEVKYDAFGNEYSRIEKLSASETGAWTRKDSGYCSLSDCPTNAAFYTRIRVSGGGETIEYFDVLGRVMRAGKIGFDGRWVYTDTEYDHLSRVKRQSLAFYAGSSPQDWTENHYDVLGRIVQVDSPHEQGIISSKSEYAANADGLQTTLINPKGQKRKEMRNGLGQLIYVEDQLGGSISYEYSVLGELLSVTTRATDAADAVVKMCYDELGRKTGMFDPDKGGFSGEDATCETVNNWTENASGAVDGWWHYRYNAFGELLEQRDPKGQRTLMKYDELGRMINRKDYKSGSLLEAHTAWFYDTPFGESAPTDKTQGKLTAVVMSNNTSVIANSESSCDKRYNNHCVIYSYNDRGLVDMTWTQLSDGQDYFTETKFDSIGRAYEQRDVINGSIFTDSGVQTHFNDYGYAYRTVDIAPWDGTNGLLSTIKEVNVNGQVTKELRGNGLETVNTYYPQSGLLQSQVVRDALGINVLQSNHYTWDELGNLTSRANRGAQVFKEGQSLQQNNRKESFCYDALNRLVKALPTETAVCSGASSLDDDIAYDGLGNITRKKGVGDYLYNRINGGPHAVTKAGGANYSYDNNGNMVAESGSSSDLGNRTFEYTSYDMVKSITRAGSASVEFKYGPDRARWQRVDNNITTTTYLGNVERIETANNHEVEWKRTVADVVHTYKTTIDSDKQNLQILNASKTYLYKDHLGSVDIITDQVGTPTHSMSFDPWGARRKGDSNDILAWVKSTGETDQLVLQNMLGSLSLTGFNNPITRRGFTGHEMVDDMGIIHMNGRIYDAKLARFLQADPFIQAATNTQSFNRYSYVMNNPLNATDPSGFLSLKHLNPMSGLERKSIRGLAKIFGAQTVNLIGSAVASYYGGAWGAAAWNYQFTRAMGGSSSQAFSAATIAAISAGFSGVLGASGLTFGQQVFAAAVFGGVMAELQGGKFGNGFASAGLGSYFGGIGYGDGFSFQGMIANTIVGGTISEITGGKFANGAASAAFTYAAQWGMEKYGGGGVQVDETEQLSSQPSEATTAAEYAKLNVNNPALGNMAMSEANKMLAPFADKEFSSALELVKTWDATVRPVADKYGVEITSKIFKKDAGFKFGPAYSDGNPVGVNTTLARDLSGWSEHGYIHTHPWNHSFSGNDINWLKYRGTNSMNMRAYVTLPNGQIYEGRLGGPNGIQKRIY